MLKENPVLGIIGGGQLGSMLATAAKNLKVKTIILTDDPEAPAKNFCDEIIITNYNFPLFWSKIYSIQFSCLLIYFLYN